MFIAKTVIYSTVGFFFCLGPSCFSDSCQKYQENLYKYFHDISVSFHVAYLLMSFLRFPRAGSDIYISYALCFAKSAYFLNYKKRDTKITAIPYSVKDSVI